MCCGYNYGFIQWYGCLSILLLLKHIYTVNLFLLDWQKSVLQPGCGLSPASVIPLLAPLLRIGPKLLNSAGLEDRKKKAVLFFYGCACPLSMHAISAWKNTLPSPGGGRGSSPPTPPHPNHRNVARQDIQISIYLTVLAKACYRKVPTSGEGKRWHLSCPSR